MQYLIFLPARFNNNGDPIREWALIGTLSQWRKPRLDLADPSTCRVSKVKLDMPSNLFMGHEVDAYAIETRLSRNNGTFGPWGVLHYLIPNIWVKKSWRIKQQFSKLVYKFKHRSD